MIKYLLSVAGEKYFDAFDGHQWRTCNRHTEIECTTLLELNQLTQKLQKYPKIKLQKFVVIEETGGSKTHTGEATIVCKGNGEPHPKYIRITKHANGRHMRVVAKGACEIRVLRREGMIELAISYANAEFGKDETYLFSIYEDHWEHNLKYYIPKRFDNLRPAITKAIEKSFCYHCRHIHYGGKNEQ